MPDIYDAEIERLVKLDGFLLTESWAYGDWHSPLFDACGISRLGGCGCLTQVRHNEKEAETPSLTMAIRADRLIPNFPKLEGRWKKMTRAQRRRKLKVFANWQRRLDAEIPNREPPKAPGGTP